MPSSVSLWRLQIVVEPLFKNEQELEEFRARHAKAVTPKANIEDAQGPCYLGIDAGSTTLKVVLINSNKEIIFSHYGPNMVNH